MKGQGEKTEWLEKKYAIQKIEDIVVLTMSKFRFRVILWTEFVDRVRGPNLWTESVDWLARSNLSKYVQNWAPTGQNWVSMMIVQVYGLSYENEKLLNLQIDIVKI